MLAQVVGRDAAFGAQEMLERCGRSHGLDQVRAALELMHKHSNNWSLDLISSLVGHPHIESRAKPLPTRVESRRVTKDVNGLVAGNCDVWL